MLLPLDQYKTFNEFFYRKLKPGARLVDEPDNPKIALSPADSRMMVFRTLDDGQALWIKGEHFTLANLFGGWDNKSGDMAKLFAGGSLVIARLAPQDYHRWHFPVTGSPQKRFPIDGAYMTVNPIAVRKNVDVYTLNKRCICPIETKEFGLVVLIAIAATAVGSINFDNCDCKEKKIIRRVLTVHVKLENKSKNLIRMVISLLVDLPHSYCFNLASLHSIPIY